MLDIQTIARLAESLHSAKRTGVQLEQLSRLHPGIPIDDGYDIQREWVKPELAEGWVLKGHKIGLTSRALQVSSQVTEPDYGALLDDMFFFDGIDIPTSRFIQLPVKMELAFVKTSQSSVRS